MGEGKEIQKYSVGKNLRTDWCCKSIPYFMQGNI